MTLRLVEPTWDAADLAETVLSSKCPWTLGLPAGVSVPAALAAVQALNTDRGWLAYDLLHQLEIFGRAF